MKRAKLTSLAPDWLTTYAGVILSTGFLVNVGAGFARSTHSITVPSMRDDLGISYTRAGLLVTTAWAVRIGSSLAAGTLAPRFGSRYIIGVGAITTGLAMLFLGYSPNFSVALGAMALMGLGGGAALIPMMGLVAPWFDIRNRGMAAGVAASGGSLAIVIAGLVAPRLIDQSPADGWRQTWYIFGALTLAIGIFALIFLRDRPADPTQTPDPGQRREARGAWPLEVYKRPILWLLAYLGFCSGAATGVFNAFFGAYLTDDKGVSLATAGQLLLLVGVLSMVSGILWGRVSDWLGRSWAFRLTFFIQGTGCALFWLSPVTATFVVASALLGLTFRSGFTLLAAAAGDHVPAHFASAAFALISVGAGLGGTLSPILAGVIADAVGISWAFALGLGASSMGVAGSFILAAYRTPAQPATVGPAG